MIKELEDIIKSYGTTIVDNNHTMVVESYDRNVIFTVIEILYNEDLPKSVVEKYKPLRNCMYTGFVQDYESKGLQKSTLKFLNEYFELLRSVSLLFDYDIAWRSFDDRKSRVGTKFFKRYGFFELDSISIDDYGDIKIFRLKINDE